MNTNSLSPEADRDGHNLRDAVLKRAVERVSVAGADALSVADIARSFNVSTAAPYRHFANKSALLHAVGTVGMFRLREALAGSADDLDLTDHERITAIGGRYIAFATTEPHLFRAMFGARDDAEVSPEARQLKDAGQAAFGVLLREIAKNLALDAGSPIVQETAFALWVFVHGQAVLAIDGRDGVTEGSIDRDKIMRRTVEAFLASAKALT